MNFVANLATIEGMVGISVGRKVALRWSQEGASADMIARGVEQTPSDIPALPPNYTQLQLSAAIGVALLVENAKSRGNRDVWPTGALARSLVASIEAGLSAGAAVQTLGSAQRYIEALAADMRFARDSEESAMRHAALWASLSLADPRLDPQADVEIDGCLDSSAMAGMLAAAVRRQLTSVSTTQEVVDLINQLFPQQDDQPQGGNGEQGQQPQPQATAQSQSNPGGDNAGESQQQPGQQDQAQQDGGQGGENPQGQGDPGTGDAGESQQQPGQDVEAKPGNGQEGDSQPESGQSKTKATPQPGEQAQAGEQPQALAAAESSQSSDDASGATALAHIMMGAGNELASEGEQRERNSGRDGTDARLIAAFLRALQSKRQRRIRPARRGAQVHGSRFWRWGRLADPHVFRANAERSGVDVAVQVLLDRSSSMSQIIQLAVRVTTGVAVALQRVSGAKTAVSLFPGCGDYAQSVLKFGGNVDTARMELGRVYASGGTPMYEAIMLVRDDLMKQRARRKVLLVVGDGKPAREEACVRLIQETQQLGIEVVGVGIGADLSHVFENCARVDSVHELPEALADLFVDAAIA